MRWLLQSVSTQDRDLHHCKLGHRVAQFLGYPSRSHWEGGSTYKSTDGNPEVRNPFLKVPVYDAVSRCSRNSSLSMASLVAKLLTWIYDNNLPSHIQVFKTSCLSQCNSGALPGGQMVSSWCKSSSRGRRIKSSVNNSFGEVLQDLLQFHVMFHYLRAIEHNLADGKKQDAGTAVAHPAETWMSVSCGRVTDGRWVQMWHKCSGFVLAQMKIQRKYCHT